MPSSKVKKANYTKNTNNKLSSVHTNGGNHPLSNNQPIKQIANALFQNNQIKDLLNMNSSKLSKYSNNGSDDAISKEELKSLITELVQQNVQQIVNEGNSQQQTRSCLKLTSQASNSSKSVNFNLKNNEYFAIPGRDTEEYRMERGSDDEDDEEEEDYEEEDSNMDIGSESEEELYKEHDSSYDVNYNDSYSGEEEDDNDDSYGSLENFESSQLELQPNGQQSTHINSGLASKRHIDSSDDIQHNFESRNGISPQKRFKSTTEILNKAYSSAMDATRLITQAVDQGVLNQLLKEIRQAQSKNNKLEKEIELYKETIQAQLDYNEKIRINRANKQTLDQINKSIRRSHKELSRNERVNVKRLISTHSNQVDAIISDPRTPQLSKSSLLDTFIQLTSSNDTKFDHFPQLAFKKHSKRDVVSHPTTDPCFKLYNNLTNLEIVSLIPIKEDIAGELAPDDQERIASYVYQCTLKLPEDKSFKFLIYLFLEDLQYREEYVIYYPMLIDSNRKLMSELPSYLCQDIMFETKELNNFLRKMLDHFYKPRN